MAYFQLHFKVTFSARVAGEIALHLTALIELGTRYLDREKYSCGTILKQPAKPKQETSYFIQPAQP